MGEIVVDGTTTIAETDENFICLTLDIWPHDECRWPKLCVWDGHASILNLVRIHEIKRRKKKCSLEYSINQLYLQFFLRDLTLPILDKAA